MRADMMEQAWHVVQPVLDTWAADKAGFSDYESGSDSPRTAGKLIGRNGERACWPVSLAEWKP